MELELTAVFRRVPEGYIAFVEELPGANSQGATLEEARVNLKEAVALVLEANRTLALEDAAGADVIRERLKVSMTILKPSPSGPNRLSSGTKASSKCRAEDGMPRAPSLSSLAPTSKPSVSRSTMNMLMAPGLSSSPVLAATMIKIRYRRAGAPDLGAGDAITAVDALGPGANARHVGAALRFGGGKGAAQGPRREAGQVALFFAHPCRRR